MSNITGQNQEKPEPQEEGSTPRSNSEGTAARSRTFARGRTAVVAIVAIVAIVAAVTVALVYWRSGSGGAGRPVPAPRDIGAEQPGSTAVPTEATITIEPEVAARAGIKTEPVGEALVAGSAIS